MQLYSLESQHANEVAELMNQNEVLKIHTQKMIIKHKQELETQLGEQEVGHNHIQYFSNMHLNSFPEESSGIFIQSVCTQRAAVVIVWLRMPCSIRNPL